MYKSMNNNLERGKIFELLGGITILFTCVAAFYATSLADILQLCESWGKADRKMMLWGFRS